MFACALEQVWEDRHKNVLLLGRLRVVGKFHLCVPRLLTFFVCAILHITFTMKSHVVD